MHRVVITGLGLVTALGTGVKKSWDGMLNSIDASSELTIFDNSNYKTHRACEIKNFEDNCGFDSAQKHNLVHKFAFTAAKEALDDSGLDVYSNYDSDRFGTAVGSLAAEIIPFEHLLRSRPEAKSNGFDINVANTYTPNSITNMLSENFNLTGPSMVSLNACSSGNHAISWAADLIQNGKVDMMVVGGSETINQTEYTHFHNVKALSPERCRPFDKNRDGLLIGEGAGIMILESFEFASKRGAKIYAELKGAGLSCDGFHMTAPHPEGAGAVRAINEALLSAELSYDDIDYLSAHGTGTPLNDRSESVAIHTIFKDKALSIPCSSIKSMIGHSMGAASAIESIVCCLTIHNKVVPPTINYETSDPECNIDCVPNTAREVNVKNVINNSFAFGGNNAVLIFGEV
ncbi:MAG: beta-ketoacyl-[acyl-carrier-protein] synthase family protein [Candidatus Anammoxibacter sp.]